MPAWSKRRQTSRVAQSKSNISTSIQKTGFAIRDWFGPYYTLGCLVAVAIGFCAIIEPSGWLVRAVTGALVLATLITFSLHLVRSRQSAKSNANANANADSDSDADSGPQLHQILFAVTLFFCIGLVISEFLLHGKRPGQSAPQTTSAAQTATSEPAAAPASSAAVATPAVPAMPAPAVAPAPTVTAAPAVAAVPAAVTAKPEATTATQKAAEKPVTKPAPQPKPQRTAERKEPKERAEPQPRRTSAPAAQAGDPQRCSQLIQKFSLGQNLSEADTQYLRSSCH